ncbi:MAG: SPOC like C-terminal domain-containing protein [Monoraphidium minutum]|nr:MAG: SPOC like C-terminal domain-containing protein [Monoraphidium minutum]
MDDEYAPEALEEAEGESRDEDKWAPSRQAIVALIDASPGMLQPAPEAMDEGDDDEGGGGGGGGGGGARSYLRVAVDAVVRLMRWRIMHAPNDDIGVMFYGAGSSNVDAAYASVFELAPLEGPDVAVIHRLQEFTDDQFREEVGSREGGGAGSSNASAADDLRSGLWAAFARLQEKTKTSKHTSKHVFVFTCDEDPTAGNARSRELTDQRLDMMHGARVALEVFPLLALERRFDMAAFWNHAIQVVEGRGDESDVDEGDDGGYGGGGGGARPTTLSHSDVESYIRSVLARTQPARANARLELEFPRAGPAPAAGGAEGGTSGGGGGPGLKVAVQVFALLRPAAKQNKIRVTREGYQEVATNTAFMHSDGNILSDANKRAIHIKTRGGAERIPRAIYDDSELQRVRAPCPPGLLILGFKPSSTLAPHHVLAPPRFLYPDERRLRGSTTAFIALWRALKDKGKVAIARMVMRAGTAPCMVALAPQVEETDGDGLQVTPPGLHVLQLPWRDEIRFPERGGARGAAAKGDDGAPRPPPLADAGAVAAAAALARDVSLSEEFGYQLRELPNPSLARHYEVLERIALRLAPDEVGGDDVDDSTLPDDDALAAHRPAFDAFADAVYGEGGPGAAGAPTAGVKRKAEMEPLTRELYAERDWAGLANSDQLERLTNDQLKVYLRYHGLTLGGNKADLLARIRGHVNQEPA